MSEILNSLGFVAVSSAGTPVPLSGSSLVVRAFRVQPRKNSTTENTGIVYLGNSALVKSTGVGVYAILTQEQTEGELISAASLGSADIDLSQVYLDADNSGDAVLVGYLK